MERYYGNDPDREEEPFFGDNEDHENEEEAVAFIDQQSLIDVMHIDLAQTELNQQLLSHAIMLAKDNWFWRFKSKESQLNDIEVVYKRLLKMAEKNQEKQEE